MVDMFSLFSSLVFFVSSMESVMFATDVASVAIDYQKYNTSFWCRLDCCVNSYRENWNVLVDISTTVVSFLQFSNDLWECVT